MGAATEAWLLRQWRRRGLLPWLLAPFSLLFLLVGALRRAFARPERLPRPVIVVGNLYVGGTGKTPTTLALIRALRERGHNPGVIARGHGRSDDRPRLVGRDDDAATVGDEPLLIARDSGVPVAVAARRIEAGRLLLAAHPECDLLIADDGLQHLALARDFEIAVIGPQGLGNGWVLPAGPLREPPGRLARVDALVLNGAPDMPGASAPGSPAAYMLHTALGAARPLAGGAAVPLADLARRQREAGLRILAAAGIGLPERFFAMLRAAGLAIDTLALPDHYDYADNPFANRAADLVLITAKDAVKCRARPEIAADPRMHEVPLVATLDPALVERIATRLQETARGRPPA
jgi:tetraacyldisaccharide 4'-kinase